MTPGLRIDNVEPADDREWLDEWEGCSYSTFFHGPDWARIWEEYTDGALAPAPQSIRFSDGKRAVLPLSRGLVGRLRVAEFHAGPVGTYGGWVSRDELTTAHDQSLVEHLLAIPDLSWRVNPLKPVEEHDAPAARLEDTHILELAPGFDSLLRGWRKGHRSAATKAEREGVEVALAENSADWEAFAEIYLESVSRWGESATSSYRPELLKIIERRADERTRLWLARFDGMVIAGALCFRSRRHISYWLGGVSESFMPLRPVQLLIREVLREACESGAEIFDFNPSGGHEGVASFKRGFGAVARPAPMIVRQGPKRRVANALREAPRKLGIRE